MSRLIDADKIQFSEIDEIGGEYEPYLGCSKEQIDNLPTVEAYTPVEVAVILNELQQKIRERTVAPQDEKNKVARAFTDGWEYSQIRDFRIIQERKEELLKGVKRVNS